MNKIIIPTGYMGSGSSAITDLIQEFEGYEASHGTFEYVFMHCPGGVFDLEDKLLIGNNTIRSDEALHTFKDSMWELYHRKFWWPGNYKKNLNPDFWRVTEEYIEELWQYHSNYFWYMQEKLTPAGFVKMAVRKVVRMISAGRINLKRPLLYEPMMVSLVSPEEFYEKTREYLDKVFKLMGLEEKNLIVDQLLLPFNLWRAKNYFDDNMECFVVERDPRDVFISNKYAWLDQVPYPLEVHEFCDYYKRIRAMEKEVDNPHIHKICFEDMVYRYDETVAHVAEILGVDMSAHVAGKTKFDPDKSIQNTQLFADEKYREEAQVIERELAEYLYDFPYERKTDISKVF